MLRRAFKGAFGEDELDDIYASAWVGTLRTLEPRHEELGDDEIRSYLFTAVAHQAGKELRRRKRKPVAPLELAASVPDRSASSPEESATTAEESRVTRDLLASLPPRRRAVIMLRYGWGLEPKEVCALIKGLSPRAYRKEITRGIDELTERIRSFERGEWCAEREPVLKAYAAGLAGPEAAHQAQAHLAHCRACSSFVAKLSGHLHDLGSAIAVPGTIAGLDGQLSVADRLVAIGERVTGLLGRGESSTLHEVASTTAATGGARGAGAVGAGVLAKLAGIGTAGKLALACAGGSAAITACVAAGVNPLDQSTADQDNASGQAPPSTSAPPGDEQVDAVPVPTELPSQVGYVYPPAADTAEATTEPGPPTPEPSGSSSAGDEPPPVAPETPAPEQEFAVEAAAAPAPASASTGTAGSSTAGASGQTSAGTVRQEFAP
jgi:RNA polymerase sigma factor (sigma-70 family)